MKIQDIGFLIVFLFLLFKQNPRLSAIFGIVAIILSIPLFIFWVFFTAERLIWYAAAFFILSIFLIVINK